MTGGGRREAELGSECPIKVRDVAEAAVDRDVEHFPRFGGEPHGGFTEPGPQDVLMRRDAGEAFERPAGNGTG